MVILKRQHQACVTKSVFLNRRAVNFFQVCHRITNYPKRYVKQYFFIILVFYTIGCADELFITRLVHREHKAVAQKIEKHCTAILQLLLKLVYFDYLDEKRSL